MDLNREEKNSLPFSPTSSTQQMHLPGLIRDPAVAIIGEKCYESLIENMNINDIKCIKYTISKGLGLGISAQGLSLVSYLIETCSYFINLSYNLRQNNPFSTYGEIMFISLQNIIILLLILYYGKQHGLMVTVLLGFTGLLYCLSDESIIPNVLMSTLYATTIPLSLASGAARVFTTMTELDDPLMLYGGYLSTTLNGILLLQVILYWGNKVYQPTKLD
ncbi:hypothetical protein BDB01DRAFT_379904 [Pilobolus umbonatus]|nr:hypothetical protein BDB01DRAFT_379904 [Pilobolus umbonatus]